MSIQFLPPGTEGAESVIMELIYIGLSNALPPVCPKIQLHRVSATSLLIIDKEKDLYKPEKKVGILTNLLVSLEPVTREIARRILYPEN